MKTLKKLSLISLFVLLLVGCDALGDLLTITIKNVKMTKDIEISVTAPATVNGQQAPDVASYPFTKSATIQLSQTEELEEYLDNIKEITLNSIMCNVNDVTQGVVQSLSLTINPLNITKTIENVTVGEDVDVTFTAEEFKTISNSLLNAQQLEFVLTGNVSSRPVTFNVTVTVDANFKVKVLKDQE